MSLWLIGAGRMAQDYAGVLQALHMPFEVIGRGTDSAISFEKRMGCHVYVGGIERSLAEMAAPAQAIVAVGVEQLAEVTKQLITAGTRRILLEKPGGVDISEILALEELAAKHSASVLLAYNRRFYSSVYKVREFIAEDGGVLSSQFEFTEWSHVIAPLEKAQNVKERWLLANSSHVLDLAFHLCGRPVDWCSWHAGSINWHPSAARFSGAGKTDSGVVFSYLADWQAPGRWGIELLTSRRRLILRPMEKLQISMLGTVNVECVELDDSLDVEFKPGLYRQTEAFLEGNDELFCTISQQAENVYLYSKIAGYL